MVTITNLSTQRVSASGRHRRLVSSYARPANITAYAANDVIGDNLAEGRVIGFTDAGPSGVIRQVSVIMEETDTVNMDLLIFDGEPTGHLDNDPLSLSSGDMDKLVATVPLTDANKTNVSGSLEVYQADFDAAGMGPRAYVSDGGSLYGLLVTRSVFTPASGTKFHVHLNVEADV